MQSLYDRLRAFARADQIHLDEPMSRHTTFRLGGPADVFFCPQNVRALSQALEIAQAAGVPVFIMGRGSNLIVRDGGIRALVIALGDGFCAVSTRGNVLTAQAGASLARVSAHAQAAGLSGLEFASGIPGTLGGGTAMNAGAYGSQMSDCLISADVLIGGKVQTLSRDELDMGYRTTVPLKMGYPVLCARFRLKADDPHQILARMQNFNRRRREKQPLEYPSAGSVFKRPAGHFAGALIEGAGLKGFSVGGACVSEKHAGFIINRENATAADVLKLIEEVRARVFTHSGVMLECEVRVIGED